MPKRWCRAEIAGDVDEVIVFEQASRHFQEAMRLVRRAAYRFVLSHVRHPLGIVRRIDGLAEIRSTIR